MEYDLQYLLGPECRKKILETAIDLYSIPGAQPPGLKEIAMSSSIPPGVVKRHYPSLDDLRREVLDWFFNEKFPQSLSNACQRRILSKQTLSELDILMIFFETCESMISRYSPVFQDDLMRIDEIKNNNEKTTYFSELLSRFSIPLEKIIQQGQEGGFFTQQMDSEKMTYILRHLLQGAVVECLFFDNTSAPGYFFDRLKKQAQDIICGKKHDWKILAE